MLDDCHYIPILTLVQSVSIQYDRIFIVDI
jgi:hypothetical protein